MTARKPYEGTSVPIWRSQDELRKFLIRFDADQFTFGEGRDWAGLEFVHHDVLVRVRCPVKPGDPALVKGHLASDDKQGKADERERERVWRVLVHSVKARLVAVDEGLETFEQAFLAHVVDPGSGRTVWDQMQPAIASGAFRLGGPGLRELGR